MAGLCLEGHNRTMHSHHQAGKFRQFLGLTAGDKWLLLRAVYWLAIARIWLVVVPFPRLAERLSATPKAFESNGDLVSRVSSAVSAAANNVPWRSDCFPQAIAAHKTSERGWAGLADAWPISSG